MKKLLFTLVACMVAMFANAATFYCVGSGTVNGKSLSGSPNGNCVAVESDGNTLTLTVKGIGWLKISDTNASNWADFNKNGFTINGKGDYAIKESELGQSFNIWWSNGSSEGTNNINPPGTGEYTYTFNLGSKGNSNTTLVVTSLSDVPEEKHIYLRGNGNWDSCTSANELVSTDGKNYVLSGVYLTESFKIADANWGSINYGYNGTFPFNKATELTYNAGDITVAGMPIKNATLTFNIDNETLLVTGDPEGDVDNPSINYASWYVNLAGEFNGNVFDNTYTQPTAEGLATFDNVTIGTSTFELKTWDGSVDAYYNSCADGDLIPGEWMTISNANMEGQFIKIKDAKEGESFKVEYNCATNQIKVTSLGEGESTSMYIIGEYVGGGWNENTGLKMESDGNGIYTATDVSFTNATSYFAIASALGSWDIINANRFGPGVSGTAIVVGDAGNNVDGTGDTSWTITPGSYDFRFDYTNLKLYVTRTGDAKEPEVVIPETLYLMGDVNGYAWATDKGMAAQNNNSVFTFDDVEVNAAQDADGCGYINFATVLATTADDWNTVNGGDRFGATSSNYELSAGQSASIAFFAKGVNSANTASWKVPAGKYVITANLESMTIRIEEATLLPDNPDPDLGDEVEALFDFTSLDAIYAMNPEITPAGTSPWVYNSNANWYYLNGKSLTVDGATIECSNGTASGSATTTSIALRNASASTTMRAPRGTNFTVSVPEGYTLESIAFTTTSTSNFNNLNIAEGDPGTFSRSGTSATWTAPEVSAADAEDDAISVIKFESTGSNIIQTITVKASKVGGSEPGLGEDTLLVYADGVLNGKLGDNIYAWWQAGMNFVADNPAGEGKVFEFKAADGGANASMGIFTESLNQELSFNTGILHDATLNFDWYATSATQFTVRLTSKIEQNYDWTPTTEQLNKWNTMSLKVADIFPVVAQQWEDDANFGKGYIFSIIITGGTADTKIYFNNIYYTNVDETWEAPEHVVVAPKTVPVPTQPAADVASIFSSKYTAVTGFNIGYWGQSTVASLETIDNQEVYSLTNFNYLGWELDYGSATYILDVTDYDYLHVDYWTDSENAGFGITPVTREGSAQEKVIAQTVTKGEWNQYDIPLSDYSDAGMNLATVFQIKFDLGNNTDGYVANVYFWKEGEEIPADSYVYVVGNGPEMTWDLPGQAVAGSNGVYTFELKGVSKFKVSTANTTDWNTYNAAAYATGATSFTKVGVQAQGGQTLGVEIWGNDQELPYEGDYTITLDLNNMKMTAYTATPAPTTVPEVYLRGAMNNWLNDGLEDAWKFSNVSYNAETGTGTWTLECAIDANVEFKVADASWGAINYGGVQGIKLNETTELKYNQDPNLTLAEKFDGTITFTITEEKSAATILFTEKGQTDGVDAIGADDAEAEYYTLDGVKVKNPEKGIYVRISGGKAVKVVI